MPGGSLHRQNSANFLCVEAVYMGIRLVPGLASCAERTLLQRIRFSDE